MRQRNGLRSAGLVLTASLVLAAQARAEWSIDDAQEAFAAASLEHQQATRELLQARGVRAGGASYGRMDWDEVAGRLEALPERSALLLYDVNGRDLAIWLIGRRFDAWEHLPGVAGQLEGVIARLRDSLGVEGLAATRAPRLRGATRAPVARDAAAVPLQEAVTETSTLLLPGDIGNLLADGSITNVVVVPWGAIGTVPFPLLEVGPHREPLVRHASVSISPSLRDVGIPPGTHDPALGEWRAARRALVVGNPAYDDPQWELPDLPGAAAEAMFAASKLGVAPMLGAKATVAAVATGAPRSDLLYLATHGVASAQQPLEESFIALSPEGGHSGRWTAREIQSTRLEPGTTVILSACQTGLGAAVDGGVIGLARAFQIAGANEVVMSLWNIDDAATARLMGDFVASLPEGPYTAEVLRRAQDKARREGATPAQWAAMTVFAGRYSHRE
jgi:CHAT domain